MLVLTRKRGEQIVIPGCSVTIKVVDVKGNKVRLGIAAPVEVAVLREELLRATPSHHDRDDSNNR
jgi:carbon storage regulator